MKRKPFVKHSAELFYMAENNLVELYTSSLCIANVHYVVRKLLGNKKTLMVIQDLLSIIEIVSINKPDILAAIESEISDFEDAMQNFAVRNTKVVNTIITRNIKDYKKSDLEIYSPQSFIAQFNP